MFELNFMKWLLAVIIVGVIGFLITLLFDERGRSVFQSDPRQEYVTANLDSSVQVIQVDHTPKIPDTLVMPSLKALVAVVDSDSLLHYDLYRHEQARVNIDMEEHKERIFFTWEDIKAYFRIVVEHVDSLKTKL